MTAPLSMTDGPIEFHLSIVDDDGERHEWTVSVECAGADLPAVISVNRSVHSVDFLSTEGRLADLLVSMIESGCASTGAIPSNHREVIANALGIAPVLGQELQSGPLDRLGSAPLQYWSIGSGKKGARTDIEVPPIPESGELTEIGRRAQELLRRDVAAVGGRLEPARASIRTSDLDLLAEVLAEWARHYGNVSDGGVIFDAYNCGTWYALDRLVPLQDPNRWNRLRKEVFDHLRDHAGWVCLQGGKKPRVWWVPDAPGNAPPSGAQVRT